MGPSSAGPSPSNGLLPRPAPGPLAGPSGAHYLRCQATSAKSVRPRGRVFVPPVTEDPPCTSSSPRSRASRTARRASATARSSRRRIAVVVRASTRRTARADLCGGARASFVRLVRFARSRSVGLRAPRSLHVPRADTGNVCAAMMPRRASPRIVCRSQRARFMRSRREARVAERRARLPPGRPSAAGRAG